MNNRLKLAELRFNTAQHTKVVETLVARDTKPGGYQTIDALLRPERYRTESTPSPQESAFNRHLKIAPAKVAHTLALVAFGRPIHPDNIAISNAAFAVIEARNGGTSIGIALEPATQAIPNFDTAWGVVYDDPLHTLLRHELYTEDDPEKIAALRRLRAIQTLRVLATMRCTQIEQKELNAELLELIQETGVAQERLSIAA